MREASALSLRGTSASHDHSCLRNTSRSALMPHVGCSVRGKRSCENGIRISTVQPSASTLTAEPHTASHDGSSVTSL